MVSIDNDERRHYIDACKYILNNLVAKVRGSRHESGRFGRFHHNINHYLSIYPNIDNDVIKWIEDDFIFARGSGTVVEQELASVVMLSFYEAHEWQSRQQTLVPRRGRELEWQALSIVSRYAQTDDIDKYLILLLYWMRRAVSGRAQIGYQIAGCSILMRALDKIFDARSADEIAHAVSCHFEGDLIDLHPLDIYNSKKLFANDWGIVLEIIATTCERALRIVDMIKRIDD